MGADLLLNFRERRYGEVRRILLLRASVNRPVYTSKYPLVTVAIVAAVVGWVGYLIPVAVLLGAGLVVLWLLVQLVNRLPGGHDISEWWQ
jgi:hypothetical protein